VQPSMKAVSKVATRQLDYGSALGLRAKAEQIDSELLGRAPRRRPGSSQPESRKELLVDGPITVFFGHQQHGQLLL
jgi:hypothetical protein